MRKTIEATWREGFLNPDALVAPKVNDLYTRKSTHIVDRIQRMLKINQIAILIGSPIMWAILSAAGLPYAGGIICTAWMALVIVRWFYIAKFAPPATGLDSYHYVKAFQGWLKTRMARSKSLQRHLYSVSFSALVVGMGASKSGQTLIRMIVESNPDLYLINGVPWFLVAGLVVFAIVVELFGGVIFDHDVNTAYRHVFRKLDEMVAEMEELRAEPR